MDVPYTPHGYAIPRTRRWLKCRETALPAVYADVEELVFNSLESLNVAIFESLSAFNGRRMNVRSRREQIEAEYLRPLPAIRHQMKERRSATVMRNCYVTFKLHHYSMPKEYIGKRVEIVYDADTLKIYHGLRLVTTHQRDDTLYAYTTKDAHRLPGRHGSYEENKLNHILNLFNGL